MKYLIIFFICSICEATCEAAYVQRDKEGAIKGVYENLQPGYAEEWLEPDSVEVTQFKDEADARINQAMQKRKVIQDELKELRTKAENRTISEEELKRAITLKILE